MNLGVLTAKPGTVPYQKDSLEIKLEELGLWKPEELIFDYSLVLPMDKHVVARNGRHEMDWRLEEGALVIRPHTLVNFVHYAGGQTGEDGCFGSASRMSEPALVFETGDGVEEYFRFHFLARGGNLTEIVRIYKDHPEMQQIDLSYVKALDLLGLGEKAPEDFRRKYDEMIFGNRTQVVNELYQLSFKEQELKKKIESVQKNAKGTPHERDVVFLTWEEKETLRDIPGERARLLNRAKELGVDSWSEKISLIPGVEVTASEFFKGVQEYHSQQTLKQAQRN